MGIVVTNAEVGIAKVLHVMEGEDQDEVGKNWRKKEEDQDQDKVLHDFVQVV